MASQELKATSPSGPIDPMLSLMKSKGMALTAEMYIALAYPDKDLEDVMSDPEAMAMLPAELQQEG